MSFCCCKGKTEKEVSLSTNSKVLDFKIKFVADADSVLRMDKNKRNSIYGKLINKTTDTVIYGKGAVYISCLTMATGCAEYTGNITFQKDTLYLELLNKGKQVCTEQNCYHLFYKIENPALDSFVIIKP